MLNQVVLVGRVKEWRNDKIFVLSIPSSEEETVDIPITISENMMDNVKNYMEINSVVGVKGKFMNNDNHKVILFSDRISYLSSGKGDEV